MSTTEDQIAQSVSELSQSAWRATHSKEVVAWLCELAQAAASAPCGRTMAREQSLGLAQVLGASHCGTAFRNGDRLLGELRNMAGEVVGPVTVSLADESSPIVEAYNGDSVNIAGDIGLMRGLKSTAAVRLGAKSNALGVALLAHHQPRTWHDEDLALIEAFAQHVRAVHDRETKRNELQRQSALLETLQESMEAGVILLSPDGRITEVNAAAAAIAGFEATELIGRSLWSALLVAEDLQQVKQSFARLQKERATERFECFILTKEGERRRVSWSISQVAGDADCDPAIICTGIDITDRCEAVERAVRAEAATANARRMFADLQERIQRGEEVLNTNQVADRLPQGVEFERRARARREYPYVQRVAPLYENQTPTDGDFVEMRCHDISSRGFAFVTRKKPNFDKVVVAFGTAPATVYLSAEVRHVTGRSGMHPTDYVVGCRYTGRVRKI